MENATYLTSLTTRIVDLIKEGLEANYKMLSAVTREDWDSADAYNSVCEDIEAELNALVLIKETLY